MPLGNRLKEIRKAHHLTLEEMANNLNDRNNGSGFSKGRLSMWENGKDEPRLSSLKAVADMFGVSIDYFFDDLPRGVEIVTNSRKIPVLGEIACGDPILAEENIETYIDEPANDLPFGTLFYLKAKGESMKPTIPNGSRVLIRQQPDVEDGEIAAVLLLDNNSATLKRVKRTGGIMLLLPDNSAFEPIVVNEDNPARILGKAIRCTTDLN